MKKEEIKQTKVEFDATEIGHLKSAIKKINEETSRIGLNKAINLTSEEITVLKDIDKTLSE